MLKRQLLDPLWFVCFLCLPGITAAWAVSRYPYLVYRCVWVFLTRNLIVALPLLVGLDRVLGPNILDYVLMDGTIWPYVLCTYLWLITVNWGFSIALFGAMLEERRYEEASGQGCPSEASC
jgi:hypothetical protein